MHSMIAWFTRNDVAANLLMIVIIALGLFSLSTKIPIDMFPEFEVNSVQVSMSLPGASPQEVEEGVTIRIEEALQDLQDVERITSTSSEGAALVVIEVLDGADVQEVMDEIKLRVDSINNLPVEAERPIVRIPQRLRDAIGVIIYGDYDAMTLRRYAEDVRDEIVNLKEVSQVKVDNTLNFEISIEVSEMSLRKYGLTLEQVANVLRQNSRDVSGGNLKTEGGEIFIRSRGQAYNASDFASIPIITTQDGSLILLKDIATIKDGFEETPLRMRFNGKPAIEVEIFRTGLENIIEVNTAVKEYLVEKQRELPVGLEMTHWRDRSEYIKARLNTMTQSAWQGAFLVILLLALFLRPAVAFWVCLGIPMSFMGAFLVMPFFDISLNIMSIFAFILVLGIVVDDAIVTGENVYSHLQSGKDPYQAAIDGTQEVAVPVTFGILTTIAAFLPLAIIGGRLTWYESFPYVIIPVLLFSLVESKLVLPAHLKHVKRRTGEPSRFTRMQQGIASSLERFINDVYQPILARAIRWRYATWIGMVCCLILAFGAIFSGLTRTVWFPRITTETLTGTLIMPTGTAFESTDQVVAYMTDKAKELKLKYIDPETGESVVRNIYSISGGRNSSTGRVRVETLPEEKHSLDVTPQQLVNEWRKMVGPIAGAEQLNFRAEWGRRGSPISVELRGKNPAQLSELGEKLKAKLREFEAVFDIEDSASDGKEELQLELKPEATLLGLDLNTVARQVRQAVYGFEVQRIQRGREDVRVMVRYPEEARRSIETLEQMTIRVSREQEVPLWQVANVTPGISPTSIQRIDRQRTLTILSDFNKQTGNLNAVVDELKMFLENNIAAYPGVSYEFAGEVRDQKESISGMLFGLFGLIALIYILLAIPFKSYFQPIIVISVIPFGIIGATIGHILLGLDMSLLSLMGILALSGVVVNDSLVLVDFINQKRKQGMDAVKAAYLAGGRRFRPVILTSLTTFAGLAPLLLDSSRQAQFLIPMAVSLGFGILFATVITLFIVPINYLILEDIKKSLSNYSKVYVKDMKLLINEKLLNRSSTK